MAGLNQARAHKLMSQVGPGSDTTYTGSCRGGLDFLGRSKLDHVDGLAASYT